jgi:hypothetical protein
MHIQVAWFLDYPISVLGPVPCCLVFMVFPPQMVKKAGGLVIVDLLFRSIAKTM